MGTFSPRAAFVCFSREMLNVSHVFHPSPQNVLDIFVAWIWIFISGWSSVNLRFGSRLCLNLLNDKMSRLCLGFGAGCLKEWSLVSEAHIKTPLRNAMIPLTCLESKESIRHW